MEDPKGMTAQQARAILAAANGRNVQVKVKDKDIRTEPHKAILIAVKNDRIAIIKPHNHGHNEEVELNKVFMWKAGNIDYPEMEEIFDSSLLIQNPIGGLSKSPKNQKWCVLSRAQRTIWCGPTLGWQANPRDAAIYPEHSHAARAVGKLKANALTRDAEVIPKEEAYSIMGTFYPTVVSAPPREPVMNQAAIPTLPRTSAASALEDSPKPISLNFSELMDINVDEILNEDSTNLQKAMDNRREAAEKFKTAKQVLELAAAKLKHTNDVVVELMEKVAHRGDSNEAKPVRRGLIKQTVLEVMGSSSRLSIDAVVDKCRGKHNELTPQSIKQTLYGLISQKKVGRENDDVWLISR